MSGLAARKMTGNWSIMKEDAARMSKSTLTDQAYERIRKEILVCTLKPGDEFTELDIAKRYAMSKTPVREALMKLQFDGLVRAYPRRGYMVEPVKVSDINDIFDMRLVIEGGAVELAVQRMADIELAELSAIATSISDEVYAIDPDRSHSVNNRFHECIAKISKNDRLHRSIVQLLRELERFFYIEAQASTEYPDQYASHADIVGAMARGDIATARSAMHDHIEGTRNILVAALFDGRGKMPLRL